MPGVEGAGTEQIARKFVAGIQAERARQPDREEAAALLEEDWVNVVLPTEDGSRFRHPRQVGVRVRHQFWSATEQRLDRSGSGLVIGRTPVDEAQEPLPRFRGLGGKVS